MSAPKPSEVFESAVLDTLATPLGAPGFTRDQAVDELRRLAAGVVDTDEHAAAGRLLERLAMRRPELRDALLEHGALALVREVRG